MYELVEFKEKYGLKHNILFIFQPSEEANAGAKLLMDAFDFNSYHIKVIFGMHLMPDAPTGDVRYKNNDITASATEYRYYINGQSAHVANKHTGHAASEALLLTLQQVATIQQFHLPGLNKNIVHIGQFNAGEAINTVPSNGYLEGTIRTYSSQDLSIIKNQMLNIAKSVALSTQCHVQVEFSEGYPATYNDASLKSKIDQACQYANLMPVILKQPYLFGEDFAFYRDIAPSYFVFVGCRNEALGHTSGLHTNTFNFDEAVLFNSLNLFIEIVRSYENEC